MSFHNVNSLWGGIKVLIAGLDRQVPEVSATDVCSQWVALAGKLNGYVRKNNGYLKSGQNMGKSC